MRIGNYLPGQRPGTRQDTINRALAKQVAASEGSGGGGDGEVTNVMQIIEQYIRHGGEGLRGPQGETGPQGPQGEAGEAGSSSSAVYGSMFHSGSASYSEYANVIKFNSTVSNGIACSTANGTFTIATKGIYTASVSLSTYQNSYAAPVDIHIYRGGNFYDTMGRFFANASSAGYGSTAHAAISPVALLPDDVVKVVLTYNGTISVWYASAFVELQQQLAEDE